jgi:hypothetical protein
MAVIRDAACSRANDAPAGELHQKIHAHAGLNCSASGDARTRRPETVASLLAGKPGDIG